MICKSCGEYMEYAGEGEDAEGEVYDLYICIECGYETAVARLEDDLPISYPEWDPPDGLTDRR